MKLQIEMIEDIPTLQERIAINRQDSDTMLRGIQKLQDYKIINPSVGTILIESTMSKMRHQLSLYIRLQEGTASEQDKKNYRLMGGVWDG
jgi:chaperonin cofactor prefoldin